MQRHKSVLHWQLRNPLLVNTSNLFSSQRKLEQEPGKQDGDTTTRQRGCVRGDHTARHQTLLARDWASCSPTAPSPGPNGADWSHFTAGPMQPAEQNRAELVAQGPKAQFKDQSMLCCWQPGERGGTFNIHKPLSDTEASIEYVLKYWLLGLKNTSVHDRNAP